MKRWCESLVDEQISHLGRSWWRFFYGAVETNCQTRSYNMFRIRVSIVYIYIYVFFFFFNVYFFLPFPCLLAFPFLFSFLCRLLKFHLGSMTSKQKQHPTVLDVEELSNLHWGIGHPMSPFELKVSDRVDAVLATLHSTLSLGLGYVSSTPGQGLFGVPEGSFTTTTPQRFQDSPVTSGCSGQEKLSILQDLLHSSIGSEHLCRCTPSRRVITRSTKNMVKQCAAHIQVYTTYTYVMAYIYTFVSCARCRPVLFM